MNHPNRSRRRKVPKNLIESAYQFALDMGLCKSFAEFGRWMNGELKANHSAARWREWRYALRPIPDDVQRNLVDLALSHALEAEGMDPYRADDLAPYLLPPERQAREIRTLKAALVAAQREDE